MTEPALPLAAETGRVLRNRLFEDLRIGDSVAVKRTLTLEDVQFFALQFAGIDPRHIDAEFDAAADLLDVFTRGMWGGSLLAALLGTELPGLGTQCHALVHRFHAPLRVGDTLTVRATVQGLDPARRLALLACVGTNQAGAVVLEADAEVVVPARKIEHAMQSLPEVRQSNGAVRKLLDHVRLMPAIRVAVVHPCDDLSLKAALDAHAAGLIEPVLVAPPAKLQAVAARAGLDMGKIAIEPVPHSHAAAARAAEMAGKGEVEALMKGSLHTDELMAAVLSAAAGLRTKRRVSHCFLMQSPAYPRPFIITDAAINIAPDLDEKADIVRNAIDLAHVIGVAEPRVAILAAVETVNPRMPATLDAAALCKMADRGQIAGALLDGPLAFDNAVSAAAARIKGIESKVAGQADILVVPDLESGNMLAKQLEYMGNASSAGIVLGAKVPIVLTSRADSHEARIASCAIALILAHHYRSSPP